MTTEKLENEVANLIKEHVAVGYTLRPDGLVDPETIFVSAHGAAHMVVHRMRGANEEPTG